MISQVSLSTALGYLPSVNALNMADAKTKKIAFAFFASITFAIGILALATHSGPLLFIAIPAFVTTGILTWAITKIKNYASPAKITLYLAEEKKMTLDEMVREHGWDNIMRYHLFNAETFPEKFCKATETKTMVEIITLYRDAETARLKYKCEVAIPKPCEFRGKWQEEVKGKSAVWIFNNWNMDLLHEHQIIQPEFKNDYDSFKKIEVAKDLVLQTAQNRCFEERDKALNVFNECLTGLGLSPNEVALKEFYSEEVLVLRTATLEMWFTSNLQLFENIVENQENEVPIDSARKHLFQALEKAKKSLEETIAQTNASFSTKCSEINDKWKQ